MDENQENNGQTGANTPEAFISRLTVSKVANLGNYENRKIEISVNFSKPGDVGEKFTEIEQIIDDINCTKDFDQYALRQARNYLSTPSGELSEFDVQRLPHYRKTVEDYEKLESRRKEAIEKLNRFGGVSEYRDAKDDWDDDDDRPY